MSKNEYINELRARIAHLPEEERDAALTYYIEYLEEVGEENIQQVIQQLGTPRDVAERIIADYAARNSSATGQNGYDPFASGSYRPNTPPFNNSNNYQQKEKGNHGCLIAAIAVLTSFIWLPILLGVIFTILGILFAIVMVMIVLAVGGVVGVIAGIKALFWSPSEAIFLIGAGIASAGLFFLALVPVTMLFTRFLPWVWRCIRGKKKQEVPHYQPSGDPGPYADSFRQQNENWNRQEEPAQEETYRRPPEPEYHSPFGNDVPPEKNTTATLNMNQNPNAQYSSPFQSPKDDLPKPTLETPGADAKAPEQKPTLETPVSDTQDTPAPELKIDTVAPVVTGEDPKPQMDTNESKPVEAQATEEKEVEAAPAPETSEASATKEVEAAPAPEISVAQPVEQQESSADSIHLVNDWDTQKAIEDTITLVQDVEDDIKSAETSDTTSTQEKQ